MRLPEFWVLSAEKALRGLGDFVHRNFTDSIFEERRKAREGAEEDIQRAREQINLANRVIFQVNQDRALLKQRFEGKERELTDRVTSLETSLQETTDSLGRAERLYGEQWDLAKKREPKEVLPRVCRLFAAIDRSRKPVIYSLQNGVVVHANFKAGIGLIGSNLETYFVEKQFPPAAGQKRFEDVGKVVINGDVYAVQKINHLLINGEYYGKVTRLRREGAYQHFVEGLHNAARALYLERRAKPQET